MRQSAPAEVFEDAAGRLQQPGALVGVGIEDHRRQVERVNQASRVRGSPSSGASCRSPGGSVATAENVARGTRRADPAMRLGGPAWSSPRSTTPPTRSCFCCTCLAVLVAFSPYFIRPLLRPQRGRGDRRRRCDAYLQRSAAPGDRAGRLARAGLVGIERQVLRVQPDLGQSSPSCSGSSRCGSFIFAILPAQRAAPRATPEPPNGCPCYRHDPSAPARPAVPHDLETWVPRLIGRARMASVDR